MPFLSQTGKCNTYKTRKQCIQNNAYKTRKLGLGSVTIVYYRQEQRKQILLNQYFVKHNPNVIINLFYMIICAKKNMNHENKVDQQNSKDQIIFHRN